MLPRILSRVVGWAKADHFYGLEFEERGEPLWAFRRTWEKGTFRRVAVDVVDRFTVDATHDVAVLGQLWLQWVVRRPLMRFLAGHMCWLTHTENIWEVGTRTDWWSIPFLVCVS